VFFLREGSPPVAEQCDRTALSFADSLPVHLVVNLHVQLSLHRPVIRGTSTKKVKISTVHVELV